MRRNLFLRATALLVGTMVGAGIFGIPFAFAKAGFWIGLAWLGALALMTILYNLAFAELTLRTQGTHQIAGYIDVWLGPAARRVAFFALILSGYGVLLAYMILAGQFLHTVLSQYIAINPDWYAILFAAGWSLLVLSRLRVVATVDLVMAGLLVAVVAFIGVAGIRHVNWANFSGTLPEYWFLPYGIILFALSGASAIPIQRQLLTGRERLLKPAIITAVALVSVLYLIFAFTVVGMSGEATSPDALSGLYGIVGSGVLVLGSLFGVMTISTSFLMMATALYETFHIDYGIRRVSAWLLVIVPPLVFYGGGLRNFIDLIGLVGSVAVGILSVLVLAAYLRSRRFSLRAPEFTLPLPTIGIWFLMALFTFGILYALVVR